MSIRCAVVLLGAALAATACTGGSVKGPVTPSPSGPRLGQQIDERPTLRALAVDAGPLWTDRAVSGFKFIEGAGLRGDAAILVGSTVQGASDRLAVVDAATGKTRWSLRQFQPLRGGRGITWRGGQFDEPKSPQVIERGGDWGVLVGYFKTACRVALCFGGSTDETGLALLSGQDGKVRWRLPLVPSRTSKAARAVRGLRASLVAVGGSIAVARVDTSEGQVADTRLIAVDLATGRRLWTRTGVQPAAITGGTVFGRATTDHTTRVSDPVGGSVVAMDAATGRTRWSLPDSRLVIAAGGLALAARRVGQSQYGADVLLDAASGRELDRAAAAVTQCVSDAQSLIACETGDRLVTIAFADRRFKVAKRELRGYIRAVWRGHILLTNDIDGNAGTELDRSANVLAGNLPPGDPIAVSDRYMIFLQLPRGSRFTVHRVG